MLLGAAIDSGALASIDVTLAEVAPGLLSDDATPGAADIALEDLVTLRSGLARHRGQTKKPGQFARLDRLRADLSDGR